MAAVNSYDMAHVLLVAVLMKLGGSIEMEFEELQPDVMGDKQGRIYSIGLEGLGPTKVRLSVNSSTNRSEG